MSYSVVLFQKTRRRYETSSIFNEIIMGRRCPVVERQKKKHFVSYLRLIIPLVVILAIVGVFVMLFKPGAKKPAPEIISKSALEKLINVSDLSTLEAVYNGVAKVVDEENSEKILYYVSYDARIKAGIDFDKIEIDVDNDEKVISVKLPEIKITDVTVDIGSLDYIFMDNKANTETVSSEAYKKCIEDVTRESHEEEAIYELARQNAKNIIEALIRPFVEQLDSEYQLQID